MLSTEFARFRISEAILNTLRGPNPTEFDDCIIFELRARMIERTTPATAHVGAEYPLDQICLSVSSSNRAFCLQEGQHSNAHASKMDFTVDTHAPENEGTRTCDSTVVRVARWSELLRFF
mmetsp:Transcript_26213/g.52190  ORF Transcript_26213/g.52190 Transcript_26213/m.52190 type:complete len:120 (-) Transcript_26213:503-862(-)